MVLYKSDDGFFEAPVDKVWRLIQSHSDDNVPNIHPTLATKTLEANGNVLVKEFTTKGPDGKPMVFRLRMTAFPPAGTFMEWLTGPLAGSWCTNMYAQEGNRTRVVTIGEFRAPGMDDASTRKIISDFMEGSYEEDNAYLRKMT